MAPRSSWKGFLKLSLVSVPVKAFTAHQTASEIQLNQLHAVCNNRIRYQKTCPEHGEVSADEIVSGYEYAKGQYVRIDVEEISKLRPKGDHGVHIHGFVPNDAIDEMYLAGRTYYLAPDGAVGQKPYALLRQAMTDSGVSAIGTVVLTGREHLVLLHPHDDLLVMSLLHHDARVKKPDEFRDELTEQALGKEELALTKTLIEASRIKDFDLANYKDDYVEKMTQLIQAKVDGQELVQVPSPEEPKILNLMEALKRSVAEAQLGAGAAPAAGSETEAPKKKMAPSAGGRATTRKKKSG
jgi:DNA end-binding protein Ku